MKYANKVFLYEGDKVIGVEWQWADGTRDKVMLADLGRMEAHFTANGVSQKFGDAYSGAQDLADAKAAFQAVRDQVLVNKEWKAKGGGAGVSILAEALWRVMEDNPAVKDVPDLNTIAEKVRAMGDKEIKAMKKRWPSIDLEVQKIKTERAAKKAEASEGDVSDLGDLFAKEA